jgi:CRISPR-associated endoribonuclease Cas6
MPAALTVRFDRPAPSPTPRQVLGAAAGLFETAASDHHAKAKPFAAGPFVDDDGVAGTWWRLGWLADDALPPGWPPASVRFGGDVRPVTGFGGEVRPYAAMARSGAARRTRLRMLTPTFFSRNGRDLPLPEPVLLVRSLLERWNAHAPAALRVAADDARALVGAVFLDEASGGTQRVELGQGLRQVGFVGQAELRLLRSAPAAVGEVFGALMRFAEVAGVGAQTTCGFGAVEVILPAGRSG